MKAAKLLKVMFVLFLVCVLTCCGSKKDGEKGKEPSNEDKVKASVEEINDAITDFVELKSGIAQYDYSRVQDPKAKQANGTVKILFSKADGKMSYTKEIYDFAAVSPASVTTTGAISPMELNLLTKRITNELEKQFASVKITEKDGKKEYQLKVQVKKDNHTYYGNESFQLIKSVRTYVIDKKGVLIEAKKEEQRKNVFEKAPTDWRLVDANLYLTEDVVLADYKLPKGKK